ncbi:Phosphoribosylaminoimidazole-succinocarboxamide synthase [Dissulfuribacter thermophilus]|uniref:Phosphoribosylaminoimidazole-succinocarboxamide synthase n=1 Tax=Dissulfuribacter thermophilus TaxID=1156395 RepID=A0A1B9F3T5_9BACT|nr:phosphoribosylaminoimidazolesuccinocarboxamide synthase [Dissulfuribacter thermophilus]OCC14580.1 Phosphoribosylaminoimidazole-succinocarboxamide synthase [Dissulfuribacter thermophilus]
MSNAVFETNIEGLKLKSRGKVRDIYEVDDDTLLIVATDRISAFDVIIPTPIPGKGKVLTQMSLFWFEKFKDLVKNHVLESDPSNYPEPARSHAAILKDRSMLVKKAKPLPVECIVRGYITGSGWKDYKRTGKICGISLPEGLIESQELATPIFTPSTKGEVGEHDENISFEKVVDLVGEDVAQKIRDLSLRLYIEARDYAKERGVIIADTKFEFGIIDGEVTLIDEVLTPDSSRFWPLDGYEPGRSQPSFDKQFVRDYLESIKWDKTPPAPELPDDIVEKTMARYNEALERLTA